jgi:hypothetical protein
VALGYPVPIQPEQFFHFSFNKIPLHRVTDLPVYGNGEAVIIIFVL